jgi:lipoyl-dependent peroxiredoxin
MSVAADPIVRHGKVRWLCDPPHGLARVRVESDAFTALPLSVPDREANVGDTSPGELLAAAYAAFVATEVAARLEHNGVPARELVVHTWCRLSPEAAPRTVEEFDVKVHGRVAGIDEERFRCIAQVALASCHKSLGMRRNLRTRLDASLER